VSIASLLSYKLCVMNKNYVKGLLWGLFLCVVITLLCGCKTKYVAVPEYHYKDSVTIRHQIDSVWLHDSVFVNQYTKGDTVCLVKTAVRYKTRDRIVRDTMLVVRRDSVPYPVEKRVTEYKTRWYDKACRVVALAALAIDGLWLYACVRRRK